MAIPRPINISVVSDTPISAAMNIEDRIAPRTTSKLKNCMYLKTLRIKKPRLAGLNI